MKTIILTHKAARELEAVPRLARQAIGNALNLYALRGQGDVKKLSGRDGYRLRVGSYRVILAEDAATILAIYIDRRSTNTYSG